MSFSKTKEGSGTGELQLQPSLSNGRKPPRSAEEWTGYLFYWAYRELELAYTAAMRDMQLSLQQIGILQLLKEGSRTQAEVVKTLGLDKGAASREVRNLEAQGLVARMRGRSGRREVFVSLEDKGRMRIAVIEERNRHVTERVFASLTPEELETLHGLLRRMTGLRGCLLEQ